MYIGYLTTIQRERILYDYYYCFYLISSVFEGAKGDQLGPFGGLREWGMHKELVYEEN